MTIKLTTKDCGISPAARRQINQHFKKIIQLLPDLDEESVVFRLMFKKLSLNSFEGSIKFTLYRKQLYVNFRGKTIDECIRCGFNLIFFDLLFRELEKSRENKDVYFPPEGYYAHHSSA